MLYFITFSLYHLWSTLELWWTLYFPISRRVIEERFKGESFSLVSLVPLRQGIYVLLYLDVTVHLRLPVFLSGEEEIFRIN